jgi:hypothetical protein
LCCLPLLLLLPFMTSRSCLSLRGPGRAGTVSGILGVGRGRPEPGPRRPTQVGSHQQEGY